MYLLSISDVREYSKRGFEKVDNKDKVLYNILTRAVGGRALTYSDTLRKAVIIMSTYEELSLIVSTALLIVAILNYTHKK